MATATLVFRHIELNADLSSRPSHVNKNGIGFCFFPPPNLELIHLANIARFKELSLQTLQNHAWTSW